MKKRWRIFLIVLLCIVLVLGCVIYLNWNTILGVVDGFRYTQQDVEKKQEENKKQLQKFLDENKEVTVRELTDEENEALANGEISEEDAIKIITGSTTLDELKSRHGNVTEEPVNAETKVPADTASTPSEHTPENTPVQPEQSPSQTPAAEPVKTSEQIISELIATLYVQKSVYISRLDSLEATLGAEFEKLPLEEKKIQKPKIIAKYMPVIADWEKTCDKVVYGILDQIEAELVKSGKDLLIVEKIDEAYQNEKRLKKAYYINNYMS